MRVLDNQKSDFIQSLEHFWNSWAAAREDIVLIVCGSAAAWMINELINHRGGLHNRVTEKVQVEPFKLREAEKLLLLKNPAIDRYQVLQLYMVMGGIPFYLEAVKGDQSAAQNIERICFAKDGLLRTEFENLYRALFKNFGRHLTIVRAIATKPTTVKPESSLAHACQLYIETEQPVPVVDDQGMAVGLALLLP